MPRPRLKEPIPPLHLIQRRPQSEIETLLGAVALGVQLASYVKDVHSIRKELRRIGASLDRLESNVTRITLSERANQAPELMRLIELRDELEEIFGLTTRGADQLRAAMPLSERLADSLEFERSPNETQLAHACVLLAASDLKLKLSRMQVAELLVAGRCISSRRFSTREGRQYEEERIKRAEKAAKKLLPILEALPFRTKSSTGWRWPRIKFDATNNKVWEIEFRVEEVS